MGDQEKLSAEPEAWRVRSARQGDASAIAALYREVYPAPPGRRPGNGYPFPQFMSAEAMVELLAGETMLWLVAETASEIIGSFGAVRDVGSPGSGDRVAEMTGLVVRPEWRLQGVARRLMRALCRELEAEACFTIAEVRTANPGGRKTARSFGFRVIGFEPFAHNVVGRFESMLMMSKVSEAAKAERWLGYEISAIARKLAVVSARGLPLPREASTATEALPVTFTSWRQLQPRLSDLDTRPGSAVRIAALARPPRIVEDPRLTEAVSQQWAEGGAHDSGVVGLRRLEGTDPDGTRYARRDFAALSGDEPLGIARVSVDRRDLRARILYLRTVCHGVQGVVLGGIVDALSHDPACQGLTTIVMDVRADAPELHATLGDIGFFPTIYYPALIRGLRGRVDALQFTHVLCERSAFEACDARDLDRDGLEVMERVLSLWPRSAAHARSD